MPRRKPCNSRLVPGPGRPPKPYKGPVYPLEQRLRVLCQRAGVTPARLGILAGLSDEAVAGLIEEVRKGKNPRPGKADTYWRLAQYCGVSVDWLLGESELPEYPGKS